MTPRCYVLKRIVASPLSNEVVAQQQLWHLFASLFTMALSLLKASYGYTFSLVLSLQAWHGDHLSKGHIQGFSARIVADSSAFSEMSSLLMLLQMLN